MPHCLHEFKGALLQRTLLAGIEQGPVGDHVWQEALVQQCFQEIKGSLLQRTLSAGTDQCSTQLLALTAGTDQSTATDHVGLQSLAQHRHANVE